MGIAIVVILILFFCFYSWRNKKNIKKMNAILEDILAGNLDRKLIVRDHWELANTYFLINEIVAKQKQEVVNLKQSEKKYRQLVTSLSHDLRTPLASLMGYLDAVQDGIVIGEEKERFLKLSYEKAETLTEYLDMLFEWLKLESGERIFHFEQIDLCELSREIISQWIPQLEDKRIDIEIEIPEKEIEIRLDESSYRRILNNLLQNLCKHSQAHKMKVEVYELEQTVDVVVTDDGIGISEKDIPYVFERLYKCDSARTGKGSGLGLAIVKELVKAHQGTIHVKSKLGEGSSFCVELPTK